MAEKHPAHAIVRDMEGDVADVARWGRLVLGLGGSDHDVSREALYVLGHALIALGDRLDAQWKAAFAAGGGTP